MPRLCNACGNYVTDNDTICRFCGEKLVPATLEKHPLKAEEKTEVMSVLPNEGRDYFLTVRESLTTVPITKGIEQATQSRNREPLLVFVAALILLAMLMISLRSGLAKVNSGVSGATSMIETTTNEDGGITQGQDDESATEDVSQDTSIAETVVESDAEISKPNTDGWEEVPPTSKYAGLIGTWVGELAEPGSSAYCYGAAQMPIVLVVKDVDDKTGMITADLQLCFHGHPWLENSASSYEGDTYIEYEDIVLTLSNGQLKYGVEKMAEYPSITCSLNVILDVEDIDSNHPKMGGTVRTTYDLWGLDSHGQQTDHFVLNKEA